MISVIIENLENNASLQLWSLMSQFFSSCAMDLHHFKLAYTVVLTAYSSSKLVISRHDNDKFQKMGPVGTGDRTGARDRGGPSLI